MRCLNDVPVDIYLGHRCCLHHSVPVCYSLHLHILRDNIADAKGPLPCANWATGIEVKFAALGMASPFVSSGIGALDSHGFMRERERISLVHSASIGL